jgi:hypothetical protein
LPKVFGVKYRIKYLSFAGILLFTGIVMFLAFNRHSKSGIYNYHAQIWADKAGYFVYLPASFNYGFNALAFPDSIEEKTGGGFSLNITNNKIYTKYSCGVAILQLPFFLAANALLAPDNHEFPGFTKLNHKAIDVAAVVYLILGLFFLGNYLYKRFRSKLIWFVLFSLFTGTNLYYYTVDESGMSHIYSFFLFSLFLYLLQKTRYFAHSTFAGFVLAGFLAGLILLIRPSNILFLLFALFLESENRNNLRSRFGKLIKPVRLIPASVGFFVSILPQLIYWQYTYGSFFFYSYGKEGFNWLNPQLLQTWFSPNNGLFLYTPFFLIILFALVYSTWHKKTDGLLLLLLFFIISYVFASWWDWGFGCSFGARSYIEYYAVFSVPLTQLFIRVWASKAYVRVLFFTLVVVMIAFNLKMTYCWDGCFYGNRFWDWKTYIDVVLSHPR